MPAVRGIVRDAERRDYRMSSFILGVVNSAAFQNNDQVQHTESTGQTGGATRSR